VSACQLVIFDCDGVLVDSELITTRVFAEMLGELGMHFTLPEMFDRFVGRSMKQCCESIAQLLQRPMPAEFVGQFHSRAAAALGAELKAVAGIETRSICLMRIACPIAWHPTALAKRCG